MAKTSAFAAVFDLTDAADVARYSELLHRPGVVILTEDTATATEGVGPGTSELTILRTVTYSETVGDDDGTHDVYQPGLL